MKCGKIRSVFIPGGGGREFMLAKMFSDCGWRVHWCAGNPMNCGYLDIPNCFLADVSDDTSNTFIDYCREKNIGMVAIGPEAYLAAGYADEFEAAGIPVFGPTKESAGLETSKYSAKLVMEAANIPTAAYKCYDKQQWHYAVELVEAHFACSQDPIVVKADGLCAGKGAMVCRTLAEAMAAIERCFIKQEFGKAGHKILIEKFLKPASGLTRAEFSSYRLIIGDQFLPTPESMDYKPVLDGDLGPNGGGSGVVSHPPFVTPEVTRQVDERIVRPLLAELKRRGLKYRGVLYLGLILTDEGPKVVEFNVRWGDPECQALMALHVSGLDEVMYAIAKGESINHLSITWSSQRAVGVIMHAEGYPGTVLRKGPENGDIITGLEEAKKVKGAIIVHASTTFDSEGRIRTSGGRVLCALAVAKTTRRAAEIAYNAVGKISWDGEHHRSDIGKFGCEPVATKI